VRDREIWAFTGLVLASVVVETAAAPYIGFRGVRLDLTLILTVLTGLVFGGRRGAAVGFATGFLQDVLFGRYLGVFATAHLFTGLGAGMLARRVFRENLLVPLAVVAGGSLLNETIALLLFSVLGAPLHLGSSLIYVILPAALYNALVAPLFYSPMLRLRLYFARRRRARRSVSH